MKMAGIDKQLRDADARNKLIDFLYKLGLRSTAILKLMRALEAGNLVHGSALKIENLDDLIFKSVTFDDTNLKLWPSPKK